jgi:hypothetical protein
MGTKSRCEIKQHGEFATGILCPKCELQKHVIRHHPWSGTCDDWPNCPLIKRDK